jgi:serine/threonine-protein kinase HipA
VSTDAWVNMWGRTIGAVTLDEGATTAVFQYDAEFATSGIEVSPLVMPLRPEPYAFADLAPETFHGLPGLLADSLPDRYGNALIDAWLVRNGRTAGSFHGVERLSYTGSRGMGAVEFAPATGPRSAAHDLEIDALVELASEILTNRANLSASFSENARAAAMREILSVGTSAGGARAKAVVAWNRKTGAVRSGQVTAAEGFEYWIIKFDGVSGNRDRDLDDPRGFGTIEYGYALMAAAAGVTMSECRLLPEGGRRHFMTKRFDRTDGGAKIHMQSLGGLAHYDFNQAGAYSYEQALAVIRTLDLGMATVEEQYRRMVFNVIARNQDDHVKNIAFLMDRAGRWSLSPAFDVTYAFSPGGRWTNRHQMTINAKRDGIGLADLAEVARFASMQRGRARQIVEEVRDAVTRWREFAAAAGVDEVAAAAIAKEHRVEIS